MRAARKRRVAYEDRTGGELLAAAYEDAQEGGNNERALALATIALAHFTHRCANTLDLIELKLESVVVGSVAARADAARMFDEIAETSEATRSQLQRLANNITSRR